VERTFSGTDGISPNANEAVLTIVEKNLLSIQRLNALSWVCATVHATLIRGNSVRPRKRVQHYTLSYGWVNTWSYADADADGVMQPETFATADEATAALDEFFADLEAEVAAGQMAPHDRDQFRIRHVPIIATARQPDAAGGEP
jgi:hypothetical protein